MSVAHRRAHTHASPPTDMILWKSSSSRSASFLEEEVRPRQNTDRAQDSKMESLCKTQYFLNPRLSLLLMAFVLTLTWHLSLAESAAKIQLSGKIGGNVTFHCPVDKQKRITAIYFQKGDKYVNGYYADKDVETIPWENTRLDDTKTAVHMYRLNVSHSGEYQCHIRYGDSPFTTESIQLIVTGNYKKPEVTKHCSDKASCLVTCFSHGGYPDAKVVWNLSESQMCKVLNSSELPDPYTMTFNSSSTAYFNCSSGEQRSFTCSVGNITSDPFSVCTRRDPPPPPPYMVMGAVCVVVFTIILVVVWLVWRKCKKRSTADVNQWQTAEETIPMDP